MNNTNQLIIEIDITHRCNMRCRHCNRLCNAEAMYGTKRECKDMEEKHIDYLCSQIKSYPKGKIGLLRIIGGEPLLSNILDYAILRFEDLIHEGYANNINIVTNGTINPSEKSKKYLVYAPVCVGELIKNIGRVLTVDEVYNIKNAKHRNITISPKDLRLKAKICDRIRVCGIQYSIYGFSYTAACFPAMFVSQKNHSRFLHYLPSDIKDFFDSDFEQDVCSICVNAIDDYKSLICGDPQIQNVKYVGCFWKTLIRENLELFKEPTTKWIKDMTMNDL